MDLGSYAIRANMIKEDNRRSLSAETEFQGLVSDQAVRELAME